jgi:hypothetical protein
VAHRGGLALIVITAIIATTARTNFMRLIDATFLSTISVDRL